MAFLGLMYLNNLRVATVIQAPLVGAATYGGIDVIPLRSANNTSGHMMGWRETASRFRILMMHRPVKINFNR